METKPVRYRRHGELTDAEVQIISLAAIGINDCGTGMDRVVRTRQVRGTAKEFRQIRRESLKRPLRSLTGRQIFGLARDRVDDG